MFKNFKVVCIIIGIVLLLPSCNSDVGPTDTCLPQLGRLETAATNEQIAFRARWTVFEYFDNGALSVSGFVQDENCLLRASIGFTAEPNEDMQNFMDTQSFREPTNIRFWQVAEDAVLGKWKIAKDELNWVEYEEIAETTVKGRFQATLVIEENGNDFHTLPDTLRFDNVSFEAVPGELLKGSN